jgi:hypothetical protein
MADARIEATINQIKGIIKACPSHLSFLISGQPGVGKSDLTEQIAKELNARYFVSLTATMDPTDVVGCPMTVGDVTRFLPPEDFLQMTHHPIVENKGPMVFCLDDIAASNEQVFAALFRMIQKHEVGGWKMRDNVLLVATGNRVEDKAAARELPTALNNRFVHLNLRFNLDEWRYWAVLNGVQPQIVGFLQVNPQWINTFEEALKNGEPNFATPRSVVTASEIQASMGAEHPDLFIALAGACGEKWAYNYTAFLKHSEQMIPPDEILKDPKKARLPKKDDIDILHSTISALTHAVLHEPTLSRCCAAISYATRLPFKEASTLLVRDVVKGSVEKNQSLEFSNELFSSKEHREVSKILGDFITNV